MRHLVGQGAGVCVDPILWPNACYCAARARARAARAVGGGPQSRRSSRSRRAAAAAAKEARPTLHTGESGDALRRHAWAARAAPPKAVTEEEQRQREAAASATGAVKTSEVKSKLKYEVQGGNYLGFGQGGKLNVGWGRKGATWTAPKEQQDVVTMAVDEGAVGAAPTKNW